MNTTFQRSWNRLMQWRSECYTRFGPVMKLPIRFPIYELAERLKFGIRVLDVGAGVHKPLQATIEGSSAIYLCMDTDPRGVFDFRSFDDVPAETSFDIVVADQVLEHLAVEGAFEIVEEIFGHLSDNGWFIATVPNAAHPVRQWDCTHVTPWPMNDLYSLMRSAGFMVTSMSRFNKFPLTTNPFKRWVVKTVCKEFRVDWCDSLMAIGQKPGRDDDGIGIGEMNE